MGADLPLIAGPREVRGACPHDCPDTCALITTVDGDRAVRVRGDRDHPITQGFLCTKVNKYLQRTYHPDRITVPLKRVGPKGAGEFAASTWPEALQAIGDRLRSTIREHGGQSVLPYSYAGTMGLLQRESMSARFFHRMGASLLERTICAAAGQEAWRLTYGTSDGPGPDEISSARLVWLWGTNTLTSNSHLWPAVRRIQESGGRVICIDPLRTRTARASDEHVALQPGTDAAFAYGVMHVLFSEGYADLAFLAERTHGWEQLRDRALGEWSIDRSADICGIAGEDIHRLAVEYGSTQASFIRLNYGMQRHAGGGSAVRAAALLPAVSGAWRQPGCGATLSTSGSFGLVSAVLTKPEWIASGTRTINMNQLGEALTESDAGVGGPPVNALIVYNANPAVVAPSLQRVRSGLLREDLFTVVLDHFLTDTARYADWVLPATTQLEHHDLHTAYGHHFLTLNEPAIAPVGESKSNTEIFRLLAQEMGYDEPEFTDSDEDLIDAVLATAGPERPAHTRADFAAQGWIRYSPRGGARFAEGRLSTPTGFIQCVAPDAEGVDPLPDYVPMAEGPQSASALNFPLILLSPPEHEFLNSSFANVDKLRRAAGEQTIWIHPDDACAREISEGDLVVVGNARGRFTASAKITEDTRPGTVAALGLRWQSSGRFLASETVESQIPSTVLIEQGPDVQGSINDTTSMQLTDLGRGATFYDNAVEIWLAEQSAPEAVLS
jgi:anaerobic selenocysteine-containing dehydrogenase